MMPVAELTRQAAPIACESPVASGWLAVVPHLDPKYGGLSAAVPALASAVADAQHRSLSLAAFCHADEHFLPTVSNRVAIHHLPLARGAWLRDSPARQHFRQLITRSAGVHIHGLWQPSTSTAARLARKQNKPYVISAHGMLERWALANKRLKKAVYAALLERANLQAAACLHALTEAEAEDYRRFGLTNPIAVIPNGVAVPGSPSAEPFLAQFPELRNKRLILFLGRIHFKKGLDLLVEAWSRLASEWPEAQLVLAGPDSENTRARVEAQLSASGIASRVTFTGMLTGKRKWSALAAADFFVLPSYSEGLSVSVLEAMGMGRPVLVTRQCNLPEVAEQRCGWVIEARPDALTNSLAAALRSSAAEREMLGENGHSLIARSYTWPVVGIQMASLYAWLGGGPRPQGVKLHAAVQR